MALSSMTGFARASGASGALSWQWELRSVNGKGLDVRLRLPPGFDQLEETTRNRVSNSFKRGNIQVSLSVSGGDTATTVTINDALLQQVLERAEKLRAQTGGPPIQVESLLALRGVVDFEPQRLNQQEQAALDTAIMKSLDTSVKELDAARKSEGKRLNIIVTDQVERICVLATAARDCPARTVDAIKSRLKEQVARLLETNAQLDPDRLHQEALLLAARADVQEELDRLFSHVAAARELLSGTETVGRKLDFLSQEFNREANTLCSKSNDKSLTAIGMDLKTVIEQLREQVQNIE
jgi:uncharacterized protein (TIGR00255 family)